MSRGNYLRHLLLSMGTRLAMIALRLARNVLLARILGPSERGLFALLSTLPDRSWCVRANTGSPCSA